MRGKQDASLSGISPVIIAAHELKSPLALLRQLSLSLEMENLSEAERQETIQHMRLVSERALRLTTNLTKLQRLEDALFELSPVNPQQLCEEVAHELTPLYRACGREITVTRRSRPVLAVASRDLLRRVLVNFADNALHYSEPGQPVVLSTTVIGTDTVRLGVRDFGPSLSTDVLKTDSANMHRPEQLHARPGSSGLGLEITKQFAQAMHGRVGTIRHRDGASFYIDMMASRQLSLL
jgi:two-component system OmpR family sensor kinase